MPLGIQRLSFGMDASASTPIAASSPLQSAIACTVPMWFFTPRRLGMTTSAWLGSITVNRGRMVQKYGATWEKAKEKRRSPTTGIARVLWYRSTTRLMGRTLLVSRVRRTPLWAASRAPVETFDQPHRVVRRIALHVVVEVDEGIAPVGGPAGQLLGPAVQQLVGVAAGVELLVAVQPGVDDRTDRLLEPWPLPGRVGHDQCQVALLQVGHRLVSGETHVARL